MRVWELREKLQQLDPDNYIDIDTPDGIYQLIDVVKTGCDVVSIKVEI